MYQYRISVDGETVHEVTEDTNNATTLREFADVKDCVADKENLKINSPLKWSKNRR